MHCLITGGAGYIGSHVAKYLTNVTLFDLKHGHDIRDMEDLNQTFQDASLTSNPITHVIHMAGLKSVSESLIEPERYQQTNVEGTRNLITVMERYNVNHLIFSSSATVYASGTSEIDPLQASNPYGATKIAAEELIRNSKLNYAILRYFNPIGHKQGYEEDIQSPNLFPSLRRSMMHNIPVNVYGNCERDYFSVCDLARFHSLLITEGFDHLILNFGTGSPTTTIDFIHNFEKANNVKLNLIQQEQRLGDKLTCVANVTKLSSLYPIFFQSLNRTIAPYSVVGH